MRLGQAERAVYEILEHAPMTAEKSALYRRTLTALVAAKLVRRREDGGHELVAPGNGPPLSRTDSVVPPPASVIPAHEAMATLTARVPVEYLEMLDRMGPNRSDALRNILKAAVGSGTRKRAAS